MHKRVLIVDDLDFILEFEENIINTLSRESGVKIVVDSVNTVFDALERLAEFEYDLIVTDMNLPDGNGVDIARFVLSKNSQQTKVAALTIYPHKYEEYRGYFDAFFKKPVLPTAYKENIKILLNL